MVDLSRNAPCHCGSGKKYKKCCRASDEAAATAKSPPQPKPWMVPSIKPLGVPAVSRPILPPEPRAKPVRDEPPADPLVERQNTIWERFKSAAYDEQFAVLSDAMNEPGLMDGEMAFDMLSTLSEET